MKKSTMAKVAAAAAAAAVLSVPAKALVRSVVDSRLRDRVTPKIGSVLYTDLLVGYIEHSGIYVGGEDRCIVELQRTGGGKCCIRRVTPDEFVSGGTGVHIYVSCRGEEAVGNEEAARAALQQVDQDMGKYRLLSNNCHMFTRTCLLASAGIIEDKSELQKNPVKRIRDHNMLLRRLKSDAGRILGADNWRIWDVAKSSACNPAGLPDSSSTIAS
ncbi:MAG: hypothetical protein IJ523_11530 [Succinivibrionaceae bacterium]|nr:hypothetical protein [Succinivibrionaceae bacterium]